MYYDYLTELNTHIKREKAHQKKNTALNSDQLWRKDSY